MEAIQENNCSLPIATSNTRNTSSPHTILNKLTGKSVLTDSANYLERQCIIRIYIYKLFPKVKKEA